MRPRAYSRLAIPGSVQLPGHPWYGRSTGHIQAHCRPGSSTVARRTMLGRSASSGPGSDDVSALSFRVLGPLEVSSGGLDVAVRGRMPRVLLATLLLSANRAVSTDTLVDTLWPGVPPRSAVANLRTYACLLRSQLAAGRPHAAPRILTRPAGYTLVIAPDELDLTAFENLAGQARRARSAGRRLQALKLLEEALGLWRGRLLEDLPQRVTWETTAVHLTGLRTSLVELAVEIRVELGQHAAAAADLRGLLAIDPLHEGWWRGLIQALHACGRTAEALQAYGEARRMLADELGVDPGSHLRSAIALVLDDTRIPAPAPGLVPAICQLPMDPPDFVGRREVVEELTGRLSATGAGPVVAVVSGGPGVGKSATAVHVAHALRETFPDGQLYVDMRGTTTSPRDPGEVLAELLCTLGVAGTTVPDDPDARSALLRSQLSRLRLLVVLDDVADAAAIRPLLPGAGPCALLVTSRSRLPDLPDAGHVHLDALPQAEAHELLARMAGPGRLADEPDQAREILHACDHLPLAIKIVGGRLAQRPGWSLRVLADRLRDEAHRLDELRAGNVAVRDSVERSYRLLPDRAARAFGLLALLRPDPLPAWTVAALAGPSNRDEVVDAMVDANLLQLVGTDRAGQARYRLPDLLRCYAAERAREHPAAERTAALRRVLDGWLVLATRARDRMPIRYFGVTPAGGVSRGVDAGLVERLTADPVAWFEAERHCLTAAVELAGRAGHAWRLAAAMAPFFDLRGHYDEWQRVHEVALDRARRAGAVLGEAVLLRDLGQLHIYRDRYEAAAADFATARALFASLGDVRGVGFARCGQGTVHRVRGHNRRALGVYRQALDLFVRSGDRHSEAVVRSAIGRAHLALNHRAEARRWLTEAYELAVALDDRHREALGLHRLTLLDREGGEPARVEAGMRRALEMLDDLGDEHCAANVRQSIGEFHFRYGEPAKAGAWLAESLRAYQRLGDRRAEATVTALLGEWHSGAGRIRPAQAYLSQALETWRQLAVPRQVTAVSATLRALR